MGKEIKKVQASADDLDDDYALEEVYSDNEVVDETSDVPATLKRKTPVDTPEEVQTTDKKKKNKKKSTILTRDPFLNLNVHTEPISVQYTYMADRHQKAMSKLTSVELEEKCLVEKAFVNNELFKYEHTLDELPKYIKFGVAGHKKLSKKPRELASPVVLVLTHSAVRAVDLVRSLKEFNETAKIAKLFAKHLKVEEQVTFLKTHPIHIGVGTPNRLNTLLEQGHLKLDRLELVAVDTERNAKRFNVFDNDAVREDIFSFLGDAIAPRMQQGKTKLGLF
ncbi:U3-containing 90S pre-ribosomal complex subunit-domain containing protein [Spinellus fusiger]|nr:U3-containing 90S pre-ribosomal complex subunit-domain containing protein [Spinellus fusiger]